MQKIDEMTVQPAVAAADHTEVGAADRKRRGAALLVIVLGTFIAWGAAYANPTQLHDAAHDSRHSLGFPCH